MARVTQEHLDARRRQIMLAAARAFALKGLEPGAATIDDIAAEADLSKGSIYSYFKNKDELLQEIIDASSEADSALFTDAEETAASSWDGLWQVARRVWGTLQDPANRERIMLSIERMLSEVRSDSLDDRYVNVPVTGLTDLIEGAQREGRIAADLDARVLAVALWNCQQGTRSYMVRTGDAETAAATLDLLMDIVGRTAGTSKATGEDAAS